MEMLFVNNAFVVIKIFGAETNVCSISTAAPPPISHPCLGHAGNLLLPFLPNIYGNQPNTVRPHTLHASYNACYTEVFHVLWYFWCGSDWWKNVVQRWWIPAGPPHQVIKRWAGTKPQINPPLLHLHYQQLTMVMMKTALQKGKTQSLRSRFYQCSILFQY